MLIDPEGPGFVASVGPVSEPVLAAIVRPSVTCAIVGRHPGRGLSAEVVAWLFPQGAPPEPAGPDDRLRVELAVQAHRSDPVRHRDQRPLAVAGALWHWQRYGGELGPQEVFDEFGQPAWTAAEPSIV